MKLSNRFLSASAFGPLLGLALAAPVAAEEHTVILTGFSYFPAITYAEPGDTIRFVNQSGESETVVGRNSGWLIGPLADSEEATIIVTEETELAFFSAYNFESDDYGTYEDAEVTAEISFAEPDLNN